MKRTIIVLAAAAALGLAGCSSAAQSTPLPGSAQTSAAGGGSSAGDGGGRARFPGVAGLVAAVSGTTAQVQGTGQQTAVSWTSTTRFTQQVPASASDVKVGECVTARPVRGASGTPTSGSSTSIAAATVELLPGQGGTCSFGGFGGRAGARPSGAPTGMPSQGAGGGAGGAGRRVFGAVGKITAVGPGQFTVSPVARPGAMAMAPFTVTYTSSTVFTRLANADASAVKAGVCVTAQGRTDDTGALTATSIAVSAPTNGGCLGGFGGRGFGGRGPGGGASSTTGAGNA